MRSRTPPFGGATGSRVHVGPGDRFRRASGVVRRPARVVALLDRPSLASVPPRGPPRPPGRPVRDCGVRERGRGSRSLPRYGDVPAATPNRRRSGQALGRGDVVSGSDVPGELAPSPGGDGRTAGRDGRRTVVVDHDHCRTGPAALRRRRPPPRRSRVRGTIRSRSSKKSDEVVDHDDDDEEVDRRQRRPKPSTSSRTQSRSLTSRGGVVVRELAVRRDCADRGRPARSRLPDEDLELRA